MNKRILQFSTILSLCTASTLFGGDNSSKTVLNIVAFVESYQGLDPNSPLPFKSSKITNYKCNNKVIQVYRPGDSDFSPTNIKQRLSEIITNHNYLLYAKGSALAPMLEFLCENLTIKPKVTILSDPNFMPYAYNFLHIFFPFFLKNPMPLILDTTIKTYPSDQAIIIKQDELDCNRSTGDLLYQHLAHNAPSATIFLVHNNDDLQSILNKVLGNETCIANLKNFQPTITEGIDPENETLKQVEAIYTNNNFFVYGNYLFKAMLLSLGCMVYFYVKKS